MRKGTKRPPKSPKPPQPLCAAAVAAIRSNAAVTQVRTRQGYQATVIVSTGLANFVANDRSDCAAGPWTTAPAVVYFDPWHPQTYWALWKPVTVQPSCVQRAVSAVNDPPDVCETRKLCPDAWTRAAPPTALSGELASIVSVTAP